MADKLSNVALASALVSRELHHLAITVTERQREDFFDPRNRDMWMDAFIAHLQKRFQQPDRIASND